MSIDRFAAELFDEAPPHPVTLGEQLSEVMREIAFRRVIYTNAVRARRMNIITARSRLWAMEAVAATLRRQIVEGRS